MSFQISCGKCLPKTTGTTASTSTSRKSGRFPIGAPQPDRLTSRGVGARHAMQEPHSRLSSPASLLASNRFPLNPQDNFFQQLAKLFLNMHSAAEQRSFLLKGILRT